MLLSLTLTNWRSHASTRLEFARGANMMLGAMGAGKSSAMDALCFALYGTYPKLQRRDAAIEDICNFRHAGQTVAAELEWKDDDSGEIYKVRREAGKKSDAWVWAGGKLLQKGARAVTEAVEGILRIDYDLFSKAAYSEQNRLDFWLALPSGARKAELDRLLGLDAFERARANCVAQINLKKNEAQAIEAACVPGAIALAREKMEKALAESRLAQAEMDGVAKEEGAKKEAAGLADAEYSRLDGIRKKAEAAKTKLYGIMGKIESLKARVSAAAQLRNAKDIMHDLQAATEERQVCEGSLADIESKIRLGRGEEGGLAAAQRQNEQNLRKRRELEGQIEKALSGKDEAFWKKEKERLQEQRKKLSDELAKILAEIKGIEASQSALAVAGGAQCPVCGSPLDEAHRNGLAGEKTMQRAKLAIAKKEVMGNMAECEKSWKNAEEACGGIERLQASLAILPEPKAADDGALAATRQKIAQLEGESKMHAQKRQGLAERERKLSAELEASNLAAKAKAELESAKNEQEAREREFAAIGFDENAHRAAMHAREEAGQRLAAIGEKGKAATRLADAARKLHVAAEREYSELEAKMKKSQGIRRGIDELSAFRGALAATQSEVRSLLLDEINGALSRLWPVLYPYGDWKAVRLGADEKDYSVEVFQGEWRALDTFASGGERACAGLAMRVAMSLILVPHLGWLVLDEPTHNLDDKAVRVLGSALSEQLPKIVPQVMVITHDSALLESTPGKVFRFERDKGSHADTQVIAE